MPKTTPSKSSTGATTTNALTATAIVEHVNVSAEQMWNVIQDISSMPRYMDYVRSIDSAIATNTNDNGNGNGRDDNDDNTNKNENDDDTKTTTRLDVLHKGTTWNETRIYKGHAILLRKTITDIQVPTTTADGNNSNSSASSSMYSVCINVSFPGSVMESAINTSTLAVVPRDGGSSCQLIGSLAVIDTGPTITKCCWLMMINCRSCCLRLEQATPQQEEVENMFQSELQDMANEAERRFTNN